MGKKSKKRRVEATYFGKKVKVLFDDGQHYLGIIVRKDKEQDKWVTVFEDGTEDLPLMRTIHLLSNKYACICITFELAVNHLMSLPIESTNT